MLFSITITTYAQIPNSGFENWTGGNPDNWLQCNGNGNGYPVTQSLDHYPVSVGTSSIRIENYSVGATGCSVYGFANTLPTLSFDGPSFPIIGAPTSLCGYYKFFPQNNDTMVISCGLYSNGVLVSYTLLLATDTVSNWTPFILPFSPYIQADSASIGLGAYYVFNPTPIAQGNSILYVDNLSFDNLIMSVSETTIENEVAIFPNPSNGKLTVNFPKNMSEQVTITILNPFGQQIFSQNISNKIGKATLDVSQISNGFYILRIASVNQTFYDKKIIISK